VSHDPPLAKPGQDWADGSFQELVDEFLDRHRRGENPSVEDYARAHPEAAEQVRAYFPLLLLVERREEPELEVPRQLGDYTILREVGRGGMGIVYEAEQRSLHRQVALKVLPQGSCRDPRLRVRFQREALAAAKLRHPHIVPVYEVGEEQGTPFFSMQFVGGSTLQAVIPEVRRLRKSDGQGEETQKDSRADPRSTTIAIKLLSGRPSSEPAAMPTPAVTTQRASRDSGSADAYFRRVAEIGQHVAEALSHAHAQGILHRDIKPSNVLVGEDGWVWVADFGLAKAFDLDDLTGSGDLVGTLRYMAPERFQGISDARCDVYGLGATLYELATTRTPFDAADQAQLLKQVCQDEPPLPRELDPAIPRVLEAIVLKAMSKSLEDRYGTADELASDLTRFLEGNAVLAPLRRHSRPPGPRRLLGTGITAIAVIALVSLGLAGRSWLQGTVSRLPLAAGKFPQHAIAVDLNGDGRVDIATANAGDNTFTVLTGAGARRFDATSFPAGQTPKSLAAADFDRDGHLDLAAANVGSREVSLHRGDGAMAFERTGSVPLPSRAWWVAAADLDGDDWPDLAVADAKEALHVARNFRDWRFDSPIALKIGPIPNFVGAWDLRGLGKLDLVATCANKTSHHLAVFENEGDGQFKPAVHVKNAPSANGAVAADLDLDGDLDLAGPARTEEDKILEEIWVVKGLPALEELVAETLPAGSPVESVAAADLDQDGDVDLATAGGDHDLLVLRNDGHGKFSRGASLETGKGPTMALAADLDGDRLVDLLTVDAGSDAISILFNRASGF